MLFDRLADFPGTAHTGGKGHQIAALNLYRFAVIRGDDDIAFE